MATRNALSANFVDVNNAINGGGPFVGILADGGIVNIPATPTPVTWTSKLNITTGISILGAGIGNTIIKDGVQNGRMIDCRLSPNGVNTKITGIEFRDGGRTTYCPGDVGIISFVGVDNRTDGKLIWNDCKWDSLNGALHVETVVGVFDQLIVNIRTTPWAYTHHTFWNGGTHSDFSFRDPIVWGDSNWIFFDRCTFVLTSTDAGGICDAYQGSRMVIRYCSLGSKLSIQSHGTESGGGRNRGHLAWDIYHNDFYGPQSSSQAVNMRSGTARIHHNTSHGWTSPAVTLACYRLNHAYKLWGAASGENPVDVNDAGGPFTSGTANGGAKLSMTVSGSPWTTDQWKGYTVVKTSGFVALEQTSSLIKSNTPNALVLSGDKQVSSTNISFANGNGYKIMRVTHAVDMPGRRGGHLSGETPAFPSNINDQITDPIYEWNNIRAENNAPWIVGNSQDIVIKDGTHYFTDHRQPPSGYGAPYPGPPHPLITGAPTPPNITSLDNVTFTQGIGGTFQVTSTGFTAGPVYSKSGGTFPASGSSFNSAGLLTVGAGSAAGVYSFTINAVNGSENDSQLFTLTITAAPTKVIGITGTLAFGDVDVNTTAQGGFTITNSGNTVLTVTNITLPAGFTVDWTSGTIQPGASRLVVVTFAPVSGIDYSGTVTVASDKTSGTNTLTASGTGAARIIGLSGSLAFGNITVGQTATRQLTVNNTGNRPLVVSSITYPEGFSGDLAGATIAAGASKVINVTFAPLAAQAYSGTVSIISNATSGTSSVAASGTGTVTATKIIQLTGSLDFGTVQVGTTPTKILTITNSGNADLTVTSITYPTGFTGSYAGVIPAGTSHDVTVTFSPVAAVSYSGTVTVASDATGGTGTTTASGTGAVAATRIIALSGNLAFGNTTVGTSPTRQMTVTNNGNAPLAVSSISLPAGFTGTYSGTLAPGASASVTITFSPLAVQTYSGDVTVTSDATSGGNTIAVSGTGVALPATRIIGISGNLAFGHVQKNHSVQRVMIIANTGTDTLAVTSITAPTGFTLNWTSGAIAPGTTQSVTVTFRPTAQQSYDGIITVVSDKTSGTNTIPCSGQGTNKKQVPMFLIVG